MGEGARLPTGICTRAASASSAGVRAPHAIGGAARVIGGAADTINDAARAVY